MGMIDEMANLRGEINAGKKERIEYVAGIKKDVHGMLKGFEKERIEKAKVLRADLTSYVRGIKKDVHGMLQENRARQKEVATEIAGMHKAWVGEKRHKEVATKVKRSKKK